MGENCNLLWIGSVGNGISLRSQSLGFVTVEFMGKTWGIKNPTLPSRKGKIT